MVPPLPHGPRRVALALGCLRPAPAPAARGGSLMHPAPTRTSEVPGRAAERHRPVTTTSGHRRASAEALRSAITPRLSKLPSTAQARPMAKGSEGRKLEPPQTHTVAFAPGPVTRRSIARIGPPDQRSSSSPRLTASVPSCGGTSHHSASRLRACGRSTHPRHRPGRRVSLTGVNRSTPIGC